MKCPLASPSYRVDSRRQLLSVSSVPHTGPEGLTERYVMIRLNRYILLNLHIVYSFQYRQSMPHTCDSHLFQFIMLQGNQCFSNNLILCTVLVNRSSRRGGGEDGHTKKLVAILRQPETRYEICTVFRRPFCNYCLW